jgi:hypothetical protein
MEKQDVLNARDEIRKLEEALKGDDDSGSADESMARKTGASQKGLKKNNRIGPGEQDKQPAEKITDHKSSQANTKGTK